MVAVRFDQAHFLGPSTERIAQRRSQRIVFRQIKHQNVRSGTETQREAREDYMRISLEELLYSAWSEYFSEPCLDSLCERVEVADALNFVIGQFDAEMIFEACEQFEGLQAVDPQLLVEIVARQEFRAWEFEMGCGKIQDFVGCL